MSLEILEQLDQPNGVDTAFIAEMAGSALLAARIDEYSLPVRLREGFAERPWPTHALDKRIVDRSYFSSLPLEVPCPTRLLEIVADREIQVDERILEITGDDLILFNIMLLTRNWRLRPDEYTALGFVSYSKNTNEIERLKELRHRLKDMIGDWILDRNNNKYMPACRLSPAIRVIDWRGIY